MSKSPQMPIKGGSYVREDSGKLVLKETTKQKPAPVKPAAKKKEAK